MKYLLWTLLVACGCHAQPDEPAPPASKAQPRGDEIRTAELPVDEDGKVRLSAEQWRERLSAEQYHIVREAGTERPGTGAYEKTKTPGIYTCVACAQPLFSSETKFDSGTGWPSFWEPIADGRVEEISDRSLGMLRTEVRCNRCDGHLGHVFRDGPRPTGLRYCINSASLRLEPYE